MTEECGSEQVSHAQIRTPHPDLVIARLAAEQHGVVERRQLLRCGVTRSMIAERAASGHLVPLHRGVYAVGHASLRREGWWLAAVLAAGPGAALSHRDAAALHGLRASNGTLVDVSTPADRRSTTRIRVHARRTLDARDVTTVDAIPVTTVARTLLDLAEVLPAQQLAKALSEAERLGKLDVRAVEGALERARGRHGPGHGALRATLAAQAALGETRTRSELEDRFVALLDADRIPRPRLNAWVSELGVEVDALWPARRLVVELDGYAFHRDRRSFQRDREKANALVEQGYRVLRFTHRDVTRDGGEVAARLRRVLGDATPAPGSAAPLR